MTDRKRTTERPSDWNWFDPCSKERFTPRDLVVQGDASTESRLQNIVRLVDRIFDHLSVFEQFYAETNGGGRAGYHAVADRAKKLDSPSAKEGLVNAERELWEVYCSLKDRRASFIKQQFESLGIDEHTKGLKVHIGSAGYPIEDWLNVDAGGADLTLNVNWGLQLPDEGAQFVYCSHLLEHLRYSDQAPVFVREIHRILARGGHR